MSLVSTVSFAQNAIDDYEARIQTINKFSPNINLYLTEYDQLSNEIKNYENKHMIKDDQTKLDSLYKKLIENKNTVANRGNSFSGS